jgi:hypothetical protein
MSRKFADWLARSAGKVFSWGLGIDLALCLEPVLDCVPRLPAASQIGGISSGADADFTIDVARFVRRWGFELKIRGPELRLDRERSGRKR